MTNSIRISIERQQFDCFSINCLESKKVVTQNKIL